MHLGQRYRGSDMSEPMGLSIGTTNVVAARVGSSPVSRRSALTLGGQVITGFVERVGDPVPLVTASGASYTADQLVVEALAALVGPDPGNQLAVAVPAHWSGGTLRALRTAMRDKPNLAPNGVPPRLVSDAVTVLTALHANPGLPTHGVIVSLDFGGGCTSITLADATSPFEPIGTVRHAEFSGDGLDQALMTFVLDRLAEAGNSDPAGTAAVGALSALRDECRRAKEALSRDAAADVHVALPGHASAVRVTRDEFEQLAAPGVTGVLSELDDAMQRNRIHWADVTAVALVGGGAGIPLIGRRLAEHTGSPLVTTPHPDLEAAVGAAVFAAYAADSEAATGLSPTPQVPTDVMNAAPDSATFRALAWSQADDVSDDSLLYGDGAGFDDGYDYDTSTTRAVAQYVPATGPVETERSSGWQRLPQLVFGLAAVVALLAVGGVAIVLTNSVGQERPTPTTPPATSAAPTVASTTVEPPPPPPPSTVTVTTEAPPPPPPETTQEYVPPPTHSTVVTTTTVEPTTTTTTTTPTTTTTTTTPTTTTTNTTTTTTTTPPAMTTSYITVPFVPVPIPIQVPNQGTPTPQYPQYPQYPQQPQYPQYPY